MGKRTADTYLGVITSLYRNQPKFEGMCLALLNRWSASSNF